MMAPLPAKSRPAGRAALREGGFTLVEVMVALLIVAVAVPALLLTLDQQIDGTAYLRDRSLARVVAANRLQELRLSLRAGRPAPQGRVTGSEDMLDREWFWSLQTQATEVPDFTRVEIQIRDREDGRGERGERDERDESASLFTLVAFITGTGQ